MTQRSEGSPELRRALKGIAEHFAAPIPDEAGPAVEATSEKAFFVKGFYTPTGLRELADRLSARPSSPSNEPPYRAGPLRYAFIKGVRLGVKSLTNGEVMTEEDAKTAAKFAYPDVPVTEPHVVQSRPPDETSVDFESADRIAKSTVNIPWEPNETLTNYGALELARAYLALRTSQPAAPTAVAFTDEDVARVQGECLSWEHRYALDPPFVPTPEHCRWCDLADRIEASRQEKP